MNTKEVADRFYTLAQKGEWDKIQNELFSTDAESIEPPGAQGLQSAAGLDQIKAKGKQWESMIEEVYGGYTHEPQVAGDFFSCAMGIDLKMKGQDRSKIDEIAVYEVRNGKIVKEQFFY